MFLYQLQNIFLSNTKKIVLNFVQYKLFEYLLLNGIRIIFYFNLWQKYPEWINYLFLKLSYSLEAYSDLVQLIKMSYTYSLMLNISVSAFLIQWVLLLDAKSSKSSLCECLNYLNLITFALDTIILYHSQKYVLQCLIGLVQLVKISYIYCALVVLTVIS